MEVMTKIFEVYDVMELKSLNFEAYEKAKQKYFDDVMDFRNEDFQHITKENLLNDFDFDIKLQYSLSYCQGDGLSFDCENLFTEKSYKYLYKKFTKQQRFILKFLKEYGYKIYSKHYNNFYCYASKNDIDYNFDVYMFNNFKNFYPSSKLNEQDFDKNINDIIKVFEDFYIDLCNKLEKDGYNYLYENDEDFFIDFCNDYDVKFLINGDVFN